MHKTPILLGALTLAMTMLILSNLACCPSTNVDVRPPSGETSGQDTDADTGTSRSNPAPPGYEVTVGDITLSVLGVTRPADNIVAGGNEFNASPEAGNEFLMVELWFECNKDADDSCSITPWMEISLVGSRGISYDVEPFIAGVDSQLENAEVYGESSTSGTIFFEIAENDTDLVLIYKELIGLDEAYLAVPD